MIWKGSPFMPMGWDYNFGKPRLKAGQWVEEVSFDEWEYANGKKVYVVSGTFPDRNRTKFRFRRENKFIQPSEIEKQYKKRFTPNQID